MTSSNYKFIKWQQIRKQGFVRIVLIRVALGWGIVTAVLYSLLMWVFSDTDMSLLLPFLSSSFQLAGYSGAHSCGGSVTASTSRAFPRVTPNNSFKPNLLRKSA